jgi:mono/diheme cytochrome c family protein
MRQMLIGGLALIALAWSPARAEAGSPTYHRDVEPILQKHCQECHRPGQVAPFGLLTYDQARKRASDLASVTEARVMPPWHASTTEGGPFRDARVLSKDEIATIAAWAAAGTPEGDAKDAPPARSFGSDWPLGPPDLVLTSSDGYKLDGDGRDELRVFVIPSGLTEGRWISAVDYKPGNPKVVHHILGAFDVTGRAREIDKTSPEPGYKTFGGYGSMPNGMPFVPSGGLAGWAPGKAPRPLPDGVGRYLPAGADVLLQIHYHKSGKAETDSTSIGLYFAKQPIDKLVRGGMVLPPRKAMLLRPDLRIPAGDPNYAVNGTFTVSYDAHAIAVVPHMHWLGKDFSLIATRPDGSKTSLIKVDRWDFNWQDTYEFVSPVALPKGTTIAMSVHFDNSAANPSNPNKPPAVVTWGEQTTNEMAIGFLQLTRDDEHLENHPPARLRDPIVPERRAANEGGR